MVIRRHVLRNSLLPTITVIATQTGYLIGGLVVVETLFNYQGIGKLIFKAAKDKDFPMLEAGVLTIGIVYMVATLVADIALLVLNPRIRLGGARVSAATPAVERRRRSTAGAARCARELLRQLVRSKTFLIGASIVVFWVLCALLGDALAPHDPLGQDLLAVNHRRPPAHWFGTDQLGRDVLSRVIVGARSILIIAPLATLLGTVLGTALGLAMGYFGGWTDNVASRIVEAVLALPVVIVAFLFVVALGPSTAHADRRHRLRLHAAHRAHGALGGAVGARARLRRRRPAARRARRPTSCSSRSCRTSCSRSWSSSRCGSATRSSRSRRCRSSASASSRRRPTGAATSP